MPIADFVHLRVHSAYSLSEGAIKIKELVKICQKKEMPAVAVTDTGNLFGALEFSLAAMDSGVQPILGCQLGIRRVGPAANGGGKPVGKGLNLPDQLVLLVQSEVGYQNLMKLISKAFMESDPMSAPQLTLDDLEGFTDGLIALTGGPSGSIGRLFGEGHKPAAREVAEKLALLFPNRLYVELMRHGLAIEDRIEPDLVDLAYALDLPLVATNDCFFSTEDMYEAHDALLCIAEGSYVVEAERRRLTPEHRFKSAEEMRALFADLPEAVDNTLVIARRCGYLLKPIKPILPAFQAAAEGGRTEPEELRLQAHEGLTMRLEKQVLTAEMTAEERAEVEKTYRDRLDFELNVIENMKFPGYFLIVSDFIKWAKRHDIPVGPGRGSGAGSVVAWSLTITDLDPLRFGLLFERFLNPERVSMPDFDIDFCQDRRDEVIRYVQGYYGHDRVAQIITFGKLQARAVLRDVGRVLQMPYGQVDKICKLVPNNPANPVTLGQAIDGEPMLQQARDSDDSVRRLIEIALRLEGLFRHASTHAAGVVIGDRPLDQLVSLYRDPRSDMPVTQFNMKYVEQAGLVKFDFLGLKTLTVLQRAVELIVERGDEIDLTNLPLDDVKTYEMMSRGETTGVFQLESSGMRDVLRRLKPNRFDDIIALVSLYRPGPMDNIPTYIAVKNGEKEPDYMHPWLEPILKDTFGIMIYQEQVMQIAQVLSGYSLGGADLLRRAMGKKNQAEMDAQRKQFIDGAVSKGVDGDQAGLIFDQVNKFAGYGFNKSHAAAYALVAYQTAFLKANYPVEFLAASMTLDLGNTDKLNTFRQELVRLKIRLLTPDINKSNPVFRVEVAPDGERAIRYALAAVKGVGMPAMEALVAQRESGGRYTDLFDLARRLDTKVINKRQLENLTCAGAFDALNANRRQVHGGIETLIRYAQAAAAERDSGQSSLFGGGGGVALTVPDLPKVPDWDQLDRLSHEFAAIGFYLSAHPLDGFAKPLSRLRVVNSADLLKRATGGGSTRFPMAGVVINRQERVAKSGNRFAFVSLSDATGVYEVTLFSELLATSRELLEPGKSVVLLVDVQVSGEDLRLTCHDVKPLEDEVARAAEGLQIILSQPDAAPHLRKILDQIGRGRGKISILVDVGGMREAEIALPGAYAVSAKGRAAIKAIQGVADVLDL
ncbi:DNA polymerase III subunit alpha [Skermanella stibiiresistens SB22]|uniref:DNA polymerase III subunit alpha n=1 Tax=Skermanella stibiiresistens SB22 TaxID=1385369 RepID=W9HBT6_9PROT|nr:DNA polymerase III subunit alpha [Skermanella stibiiresistens]EWY42137.1 DNA polymerase III subunit alpha [Skermanella stibiiresistens SB22]